MGDKAYRIDSISPSGREISLALIDTELESRPAGLRPGHKLMDFRMTTIDGRGFSLPSLRGSLVVLEFVPSLPPFETTTFPSKQAQSRVEERIEFVDKFLSNREKYEDVAFILMVPNFDQSLGDQEGSPFDGWKVARSGEELQIPAWSELAILDQEGIVRYTDEWIVRWDSLGCKVPEYRPAAVIHIKWALERLLQRGN